jgi:hypothetical protein
MNPFALLIALLWALVGLAVPFFEGGWLMWGGAVAFTIMAFGGD